MPKDKKRRPGFREWVDRQEDPGWGPMPLTHISKAILAEDIIREGGISPEHCTIVGRTLAYFFYGRPAYRLGDKDVVKVEASCPFCFILNPSLIEQATSMHAFDTGACANRLYNHVMENEMQVDDFSLDKDYRRANRIIKAVFSSRETYFDGDTAKMVAPTDGARSHEFHARAYLELLASSGRNEPDDRICSIEVAFDVEVPLEGNLKAIIVPHTLWGDQNKTPWLERLSEHGVRIVPYQFIPLRHPEHYHAIMEQAVRRLYTDEWKVFA